MKNPGAKNVFAGLVLCAVLLARPAEAFAGKATVLWAEGDVQMQTAGSEAPQPAVAGAAVPEGATLVTADGASCGIGFEGTLAESAVLVKPGSSAQMKSLGDTAQIDLERGELFIKLAKLKKDSQFSVTTPTATATARGTGWQQSLEQIEVFEGSVSVKNSSGQEEVLGENDAYDLSADGLFTTKHPVSEESRQFWESFGERAIASPYFNRINADDILHIRDIIDAKRRSGACGSAAPYAWATAVAPGAVISASQINELKTALGKPPFIQSAAFTGAYLDPIPAINSGDPVHASVIRQLLEAAENASC